MNLFRQFAKDKEAVVAFVPARVAHRQQTLFSQNEQPTQELQRKFLFSTAYSMNFVPERSTSGIQPNTPGFQFSS